MQRQEIITENGKDFLVIALPTTADLFDHGFISKSGKSLVYRKLSYDQKRLLGYQHVKLKESLIKNRAINGRNRHYHKADIINHEFSNFKGMILPCIKFSVSKQLVSQGT